MAPRTENEKYFHDPITNSRKQFPSLNDSYSKYLSVIIPAYKEVDRCKIKETFLDYFNEPFFKNLFSTCYDERYNGLSRTTSGKCMRFLLIIKSNGADI